LLTTSFANNIISATTSFLQHHSLSGDLATHRSEYCDALTFQFFTGGWDLKMKKQVTTKGALSPAVEGPRSRAEC
jgi:hypothetical protein